MSNNAKIGGILTIVSGALGVIGGFFMVVIILMFRSISDLTLYYPDYDYYYTTDVFSIVVVFYAVIGVVWLILGILGITGGIYALNKKHWGLALTGAIASCLTFLPCGVPAVVFMAMAKPEFSANNPPTPPF